MISLSWRSHPLPNVFILRWCQCTFPQRQDRVAEGNTLKLTAAGAAPKYAEGDRWVWLLSVPCWQAFVLLWLHYRPTAACWVCGRQAWVEQRRGTVISKGLWVEKKEFAARLLHNHVFLWLLCHLFSLVTNPDILHLSFWNGFHKGIPSACAWSGSRCHRQGKKIFCKYIGSHSAFLCPATL